MREFTIYEDSAGMWCAECSELPGFKAKGKTQEEALEKIRFALLTFYPCTCED